MKRGFELELGLGVREARREEGGGVRFEGRKGTKGKGFGTEERKGKERVE